MESPKILIKSKNALIESDRTLIEFVPGAENSFEILV